MLLVAMAFGENAQNYCTQCKSCSIKYAVKFLTEMLVKQNSIFCVIYFMLVLL